MSLAALSLIPRCQRFLEICSVFTIGELSIGSAALTVSKRDFFRGWTPANAEERTRWMDVYFPSSRNGPNGDTAASSSLQSAREAGPASESAFSGSAKLASADIATDSTITATVLIADPKGLPLGRVGVTTPGAVSLSFVAATIPKTQDQYVASATRTASGAAVASTQQAAADANGTFTTIADGLSDFHPDLQFPRFHRQHFETE